MSQQTKFHMALNVSNIDQTIRFYTALFGQEPVKVKADYAKYELEDPGLVISFIQAPDKIHPQFGHLGFRVSSSEILAARKSEITSKLKVSLEEENTACCYARQDKFWVTDPDGYEWEVYHFLKDVEQNESKYSVAPCC